MPLCIFRFFFFGPEVYWERICMNDSFWNLHSQVACRLVCKKLEASLYRFRVVSMHHFLSHVPESGVLVVLSKLTLKGIRPSCTAWRKKTFTAVVMLNPSSLNNTSARSFRPASMRMHILVVNFGIWTPSFSPFGKFHCILFYADYIFRDYLY